MPRLPAVHGLDQTDIFEPDALHLRSQRLRRVAGITIVIREGGDAWNPQQCLQFLKESRLVLTGKINSSTGHKARSLRSDHSRRGEQAAPFYSRGFG
jgi:hypothetical protein